MCCYGTQSSWPAPELPGARPATIAAGEERPKFRRSVGRMDTAFRMLAAIIVLDTLGAVSSYGAQSFTWLIVMVVFFLLPYGLLTAELGSAFPEEGGPYVWTKLAFGRPAAAGSRSSTGWATHLAGRDACDHRRGHVSTFFVNLTLGWQYVFGLLFVWAGIASVIMALKVRQVARHDRRGGPRGADGLLHAHGPDLCHPARPARLRRRGVQAHLGRVPGGGADPVFDLEGFELPSSARRS